MNDKYLEFIDSGSAFLEHHGILGMHWGVRRYQNKDGSLTSLGISRAERKSRRTRFSEALEYAKADITNEKYATQKSNNKAAYDIAKKVSKGAKIIDADRVEYTAGRKLRKEAKKYTKQYDKQLQKDKKQKLSELAEKDKKMMEKDPEKYARQRKELADKVRKKIEYIGKDYERRLTERGRNASRTWQAAMKLGINPDKLEKSKLTNAQLKQLSDAYTIAEKLDIFAIK